MGTEKEQQANVEIFPFTDVSERAHSTLHIHMQSICCKDEYITLLLVNNTPDKWNRQVQSHTWNNLFLDIIIWLHKDTQRPSMQDSVASSGGDEDCNQLRSPCLPSPTEFKWKQSFVCPIQTMILSFRWLQSNSNLIRISATKSL